MKRSRDVVEKRRNQIVEMVHKAGDVKVEEICNMLDVSPLTIRRDLQYLEDEQLLERYYGGARIKGMGIVNKIYDEVRIYRQKIAKYAASLIADGDTIFINTSATALGILPYITAKAVTVVTNNGNAINMPYSSEVTVILTGGELRHIKGTMVGDFTIDNVNKVTAKKTFVGCSGLSTTSGMTTDILNEVKINEAMLQRAMECTYILADYEKIGKNCSFVSCSVEHITNIITDEKADSEEIERFHHLGINIVQVTNNIK